IGIGYNVTQAVAGGTAPAFCIWLIMMTHTNTAPAVYMTVAALAGLVAAACLRDRTGRPLADGAGGVTEPVIEERRSER
ncbi:MAG: MFS transporter, partial [Planctomycetota bacterium]|nr:MFS transporter [Planctomycetota bacterium]